jgi:hypothetical protein
MDMRLGAALQIGFLKMCGRPLDKLQRVPAAVLEQELSAQSHCLALCTNLVMAHNTSHLQCTLDSWHKQSGRGVDASIQRFISPMGF